MSFLVIALAVLAMMTTAYMNVVRPAQKRHRAAKTAPEPMPVAEPKVPCDTSRPYPRGDSAATEELLGTCPVCGMADLDQMLPDDLADFFGWPAHASCKEWLGDWKPPSPEIKELQQALDGFEHRTIPVLALKTAGGPVIQHPCPGCGMEFTGRASEIVLALNIHQQNGECERYRKKQQAPAAPPVPTPAEYLAELQEHLHHFQEQYPD